MAKKEVEVSTVGNSIAASAQNMLEALCEIRKIGYKSSFERALESLLEIIRLAEQTIAAEE